MFDVVVVDVEERFGRGGGDVGRITEDGGRKDEEEWVLPAATGWPTEPLLETVRLLEAEDILDAEETGR